MTTQKLKHFMVFLMHHDIHLLGKLKKAESLL